MLNKYFKLEEHGTSIQTEFTGGLTTFLAMAYILFVNPQILGASGMDPDAIYTATALSAIIGTLLMGLLAKLPVALAPGMGINAFFTYTVVIGYGIPWETALTAVLVSGVLFLAISFSGVREKVINGIPASLKLAVGAGIGLFIAFIGFKNVGIIVADEGNMIALGNLSNPETALAIFGLVVTVLLITLKVSGGVFYGMIITAVVGIIFGQIDLPTQFVSGVPSLEPTFGKAFTNIFTDIWSWQMIGVIITFLFVDFFDTAGTLLAVTDKAGLTTEDGEIPRVGKALLADSTASVVGSVLGTSTVTAFVESATGVGAGARTGLASVFTAIFFGLALFFSPLLSVVTSAVTAPALIIVGVMMASALKSIEWDDFVVAVPAFLTVLMMPLSGSIATGIAVGFVFYPITMLASGQGKKVNPMMWILGVVFVLYLAFLS